MFLKRLFLVGQPFLFDDLSPALPLKGYSLYTFFYYTEKHREDTEKHRV
jgi:hypothetical protein